MIPQGKSEAVTRGMREAFGVNAFEDIRELSGGPGINPVFRIVVQGSPFLLRFNMRAGDVARHFTCMKAAAEAGLAPRVWYTSVEDRLSITDFIQAARFPVEGALQRMPAVLRSLHALPSFPTAPDHINTSCTFLLNKNAAVDAIIQKCRTANVLPENGTEELLARYKQIAAVYRRHDADMVSSHNDLFKPDNVLFDGQRVWLVDWEASFLNDRYADLAVVANLLADNDEERAYLQGYFGKPPDEYQLARFFLMQQLAHIFYTMAFLMMVPAGKPIDWSQPLPEFRDFNRRFWAGDVKLADSGTKAIYGRVHWERLSYNVRQPRYKEALQIVSAGD